MTWNEILILFVMVMGLFAIDMLVAGFNLKAGRIAAVLTFFVMMPLGLFAGIVALVCMNIRAKKTEQRKITFFPIIELIPEILVSGVLVCLIDIVLLKKFPEAKFPVLLYSTCFFPIMIVLVSKALAYLKDKARKPNKIDLSTIIVDENKKVTPPVISKKAEEAVVPAKKNKRKKNTDVSKKKIKSTITKNYEKTATSRPAIPSGYATPRHDPYAVSDDHFRYDPDYQDYLQGNIRPERYQIEHWVADNGQEYTTLKSEKTELSAFYREQNEKSAAKTEKKELVDLVIPKGTTEIMEREFEKREDIVSVVVPESVMKIGEYAFCVCKNLKSVVIAEGVKEIGSEAFRYCENLESVVIPDSVTKIGAGVFCGCKSLMNVNVPKSVDKITDSLFIGCEKLSSSVLHNKITDIGQNAFAHCTNLSSIVIPDSVKTIGKAAFCQCTKLASVEIPKNIKEIGESAFSNCENLTHVTVKSAGETGIGNYAFSGCHNLSSVKLHEGVISIGVSAFGKCTNLSSIVIPDSVVRIGGYAFEHCVNLTHVALPKKLKSMGGYVFLGCKNLNSIDVPENIIPDLCSNGSLSGCSALKSFKIQHGVTEIANSMFSNCENLSMVEIPNTVERIGNHAFSGCKNLEYVILPDSVKTIGEDAFRGCDKISDDIKRTALSKIPRVVPVTTSYNTPYDDPFCDDNYNPDKYNYELRRAKNGREYYARIN